ncbi:peptidase S8 [Leptolyngbya cf. ectocarpi LEGE 11479]|uniref:Peptidase S8 n=1 Tax=Leptolyngbya cf. ectocarpi LEGE 11479 TaxID=1828722 RepID=A0A928ZVL7_LEPEC|nr:S8 family serine peptidase [Leptolyngbya ectocarpi]MBE9068293.1 peptidase S8 [Leptolyngbya cf. ectocarpi LEGE 11479]
MKRFYFALVGLGVTLALLWGSLFPVGAIAQKPTKPDQQTFAVGEFDSIILDFLETPDVLSSLTTSLKSLGQQFSLSPVLNSDFSVADNLYIVSGNQAILDKLKNSSWAAQTEYIEPNYIYSQSSMPVNDPDYAKQWNLKQINAPGAWKRGVNGQGVTVAVIDTGISQGPDLKKTQFVSGYDFVNDRENAIDDNGHGTHVAGTIAQSTNNRYGVAGVAYGAKLMPLKVLSRSGGGTVADIAEAIRFAADHGANVINMSLGGGGDSKLMREAVDYAHKKGVVIVAAAGNESVGSASYPALYPNVIAVSAVGPDRQKTSYSNYGTGVDIAAPGGATRSNEQDGILQETINPRSPSAFQFKYFQGTSMAAPHVAAVAALVKSRRPYLSPDQVWDVLKSSAQPVKSDSQNYFGAGYLDAAKAVGGGIPIAFNPLAIRWVDIGLKLLAAALLTWLLIPREGSFSPWNVSFALGVVLGSVGLFVLPAISIANVPQWLLRALGSSIPELGGAVMNQSTLNPIFASLLIPLGLMSAFISHRMFKWVVLGISIGMTAFMVIAASGSPTLWLIGTGQWARLFLLMNAVLCMFITYLFMKVAADDGAPAVSNNQR